MEHVKKFRDDPVHNLIPGLFVLVHLIFAAFIVFYNRDNASAMAKGDSVYGYGKTFGVGDFDNDQLVKSDRDSWREHGVIVEP